MNKICDRSVGNIYVVILRVIQNQKTKRLGTRVWSETYDEVSSTAADGCLITHTTTDDALERPTKGTNNRLTVRPDEPKYMPDDNVQMTRAM